VSRVCSSRCRTVYVPEEVIFTLQDANSTTSQFHMDLPFSNSPTSFSTMSEKERLTPIIATLFGNSIIYNTSPCSLTTRDIQTLPELLGRTIITTEATHFYVLYLTKLKPWPHMNYRRSRRCCLQEPNNLMKFNLKLLHLVG